MLEKRFAAVPAQVLTANGTTSGLVQIADTSLFKVKQCLYVASNTKPNLELEVKKVISPTQMVVGPLTGSIVATADISLYLVADGANVFANEQRRPTIIGDEFERATYEEEPTVAKRVILVDEFGNRITEANPLPTTAEVNLGDITIGSVAQGDPNTLANAWPVKVTDGVSATGISDVGGQKALKVDVVQTVAPTLVAPTYVNDSGFIAKTVSYFYTVDDDIDRIETVIGSKKKIEQYDYTDGVLTSSTVTIEDV